MDRVKQIVGKNIISIVCGGVALIALIAWLWVRGWYTDFGKELATRTKFNSDITSLLGQRRNSLIVNPEKTDTKAEPLGRFPNAEVIATGESKMSALHKQAVSALNTLVEVNKRGHDLLVPGSLPRPDENAAYGFRERYRAAMFPVRKTAAPAPGGAAPGGTGMPAIPAHPGRASSGGDAAGRPGASREPCSRRGRRRLAPQGATGPVGAPGIPAAPPATGATGTAGAAAPAPAAAPGDAGRPRRPSGRDGRPAARPGHRGLGRRAGGPRRAGRPRDEHPRRHPPGRRAPVGRGDQRRLPSEVGGGGLRQAGVRAGGPDDRQEGEQPRAAGASVHEEAPHLRRRRPAQEGQQEQDLHGDGAVRPEPLAHDGGRDQPAQADPEEIWYAQMSVWVQQDIARAIRDMNVVKDPKTGREVTGIPLSRVKHLISIDVRPGIDMYYTVATASGTGTAAAAPAEGEIPRVFTQTVTGRVCNSMYDVVRSQVTAVVDEASVGKFMEKLESGRMLTVLEVNQSKVSNGAARDLGFDYGDRPVVRVTITCEHLFFRQWTVGGKLMPEAVQKLLGVAPANPAEPGARGAPAAPRPSRAVRRAVPRSGRPPACR